MKDRYLNAGKIFFGASFLGIAACVPNSSAPSEVRIDDFKASQSDSRLIYGLQPQTIYFEPLQTDIPRWQPLDLPDRIAIPKINFNSDIIRAKLVPFSIGLDTLEDPINKIATPLLPYKNHIFVYGHSMISDERQPFSAILNLDRGDLLYVSNDQGLVFFFMVVDFKLIDLDSNNRFIGPKDELELTLQTTAKEKSQTSWILNRDLILGKVESNRPDNISGDLVYWVIARPVQFQGLP